MKKKDYELIAQAIKQSRCFDATTGEVTMIDHLILSHYLAAALQVQNPRFDKEKFLSACGIETEVKHAMARGMSGTVCGLTTITDSFKGTTNRYEVTCPKCLEFALES